jgi:hypothetical protein
MGVKVLHFLDRVFQEFATYLSRFAGQENPLRAASASLRGRHRSTVIITLGSLRYGVKPTISLPPGLVSGQQGAGREVAQPSGGGSGTADDGGGEMGASGEPRLKSATLPEGWRIPRGKAFGEFFNPRLEETRANLAGWPSTTHDRSGAQKPMCIRLMVTGKCLKENCKNAHVKPASLGSANVSAISTRLAEIYRGRRSSAGPVNGEVEPLECQSARNRRARSKPGRGRPSPLLNSKSTVATADFKSQREPRRNQSSTGDLKSRSKKSGARGEPTTTPKGTPGSKEEPRLLQSQTGDEKPQSNGHPSKGRANSTLLTSPDPAASSLQIQEVTALETTRSKDNRENVRELEEKKQRKECPHLETGVPRSLWPQVRPPLPRPATPTQLIPRAVTEG